MPDQRPDRARRRLVALSVIASQVSCCSFATLSTIEQKSVTGRQARSIPTARALKGSIGTGQSAPWDVPV
ncbi:hypothetical protein GCM10009608_60740 [Pseudonocardia alaniniphila]